MKSRLTLNKETSQFFLPAKFVIHSFIYIYIYFHSLVYSRRFHNEDIQYGQFYLDEADFHNYHGYTRTT